MKEYKKALSKTKLNQKKKTRVSSSESTDSESEDAEAERLAEQLRKESMLEDEKKAYSNEVELELMFCIFLL